MDFDTLLRIIETGIYGEDIRTAIHDALLYLKENGGGETGDFVSSNTINDIEVLSYSEYTNNLHDSTTLYFCHGDSPSDNKINAILLNADYSQSSSIVKTDTLEEMKSLLLSKPSINRYYVLIGEDANVTDISSFSLSNLSTLYSIRIPYTCVSINSSSFSGCTNLEKIYINKPEESIDGAPWGANDASVEWLISS